MPGQIRTHRSSAPASLPRVGKSRLRCGALLASAVVMAGLWAGGAKSAPVTPPEAAILRPVNLSEFLRRVMPTRDAKGDVQFHEDWTLPVDLTTPWGAQHIDDEKIWWREASARLWLRGAPMVMTHPISPEDPEQKGRLEHAWDVRLEGWRPRAGGPDLIKLYVHCPNKGDASVCAVATQDLAFPGLEFKLECVRRDGPLVRVYKVSAPGRVTSGVKIEQDGWDKALLVTMWIYPWDDAGVGPEPPDSLSDLQGCHN